MKKQKGLSLISLIFVGGVAIALAIVAMKVTPTVIEYFTIVKHIKAIVASGENKGSVADVRKAYELRQAVDDTPSVGPGDLDISKEGNQIVISFAYSKKIHLAGNVSLLIDYEGSSLPGR
jgi:hypothetical protein